MSAFKLLTADTVYLLTSAKTPLTQLEQDIRILRSKGFHVYYFEDGFDDRISLDMRAKRFTLAAAGRELERIANSVDIVYIAKDDSSPFLSVIKYGCKEFNIPIEDLYKMGGRP